MHTTKCLMVIAAFSLLAYSECAFAQMYYGDEDEEGPQFSTVSDNDAFYEDQGYDYQPAPEPVNDPVYRQPKRKNIQQPQQRMTEADEDNYRDDYSSSYYSRLPEQINTKEKLILVDPKVHAWGAYLNGKLIRAGLATSGAKWCPDIGRPCKTAAGVFHIKSLGSSECISNKYPIGEGGAPMPYCMYFNGSQGLHGSSEVREANLSHGCVRLGVNDARWLRYNFSTIGTKVVVRPY